jgi:TatD DNase family protein
MVVIDTHCHIDVEDFDADRMAVIDRARVAGVVAQVVPAVMAPTWDHLLQVCRDHAGLHPALGLHPAYLALHRPGDVAELADRVAQERPVAIGEIGLDFFIPDPDREGQQALFEAQLRIARDHDLPVLLHVRKSIDQVLATLRRIKVRGGIAHAFNGSRQQAEQFMELGFKLGFGGVATFERAQKIRALARELPLEALVLETDAPDLPPAWCKGERNSPEFLPGILRVIAELRGATPEEVAAHTTANACAVLRLPLPAL